MEGTGTPRSPKRPAPTFLPSAPSPGSSVSVMASGDDAVERYRLRRNHRKVTAALVANGFAATSLAVLALAPAAFWSAESNEGEIPIAMAIWAGAVLLFAAMPG